MLLMGARHWRAALVLSIAGACNSSSEPGPATVSVRFDDPAGLLNQHRASIETLINSTAEQALALIAAGGVTITVKPDPANAIPEFGIGGFTHNRNAVSIYIDHTLQDLSALLPVRLPLLVAHELHHAARFKGPGYGNTLLEALISEGLADHFAHQLLGSALPPWVSAFPENENAQFTAQARPEFDSSSYSHTQWFFVASAGRPRWCGYTLGFRFVRAFLDAHSNSTTATLVNEPASSFRPPL